MDIQTLIANISQTFRQHWGHFALADLIFRSLSYVLLTPLIGWLLQSLIATTGSSAVSNTDIIGFLLSPVGIMAVVIIGALLVALIYAEQVGLLAVAYTSQENRRIHWKQLLGLNRQFIITLVGLGSLITLATLGLILPVAAIGGLLYLTNLTTYDINYYLETFPPEFIQTIIIVAPLVVGLVIVLGYLYVAWAFALPGVLFAHINYRQALSYSRNLVKGRWWQVAKPMLGWAIGWTIVSIIIQLLFTWLGNTLLNLVEGELRILAITMGGLLLGNALISIVLTFVGLIVSILITYFLYRELAEGQQITLSFPLKDVANEKSPGGWRLPSWLIWGGAGLLLIIATLVGFGLLESINKTDTVIITAHRGSSTVAPPNTLAAVQAAINDGADYAEIDVQETVDGVVILNHDQDFMLAAGNPLKVHQATYAQVQMLDVGHTFSPDFAGEKVPTLTEVLALAKGKIKVNIELKYYGHDQNLVQRVVDIVQKAGMENEVLMMSLNYDATQTVKRLAPTIPVGFLASTLSVGDLTQLNVDFLAVASGLASTTFIHNTHNADKQIFVWTLNERDEISEFIGLGVDSIITDRPTLVKEVLAERAAMTDIERLLLQFSYTFD